MKKWLLKFFSQIGKTIIIFIKPLGVTWMMGQVFIKLGLLSKPSWQEWCMGTSFLLLGGGLIKVGKGLQEKFINKT